jgi:hypothetical protein
MTTKEKIEKLLSIHRCETCTESQNVSLCHAIDHVTIGNNYGENALQRLLKAIREDVEWSYSYSKEDLHLIASL